MWILEHWWQKTVYVIMFWVLIMLLIFSSNLERIKMTETVFWLMSGAVLILAIATLLIAIKTR